MSNPEKKTSIYTSILNDLKGNSMIEKAKGRNIRVSLKKVQAGTLDKADLIPMKSQIMGVNGIGLFNDKARHDGILKGMTIDKSILDKRKIRTCEMEIGGNKINQDYVSGHSTTSNANKIDIKICVNYGKTNQMGNDIPKESTNSKSMGNSKSKSFFSSGKIPNDAIVSNQSANKPGIDITNSKKLTQICGIKGEEQIFRKIKDKRESSSNQEMQTSNSFTSHKRNISETNFFQNNLSISLMNYNNKPQAANCVTSNEKSQDNSFTYNNTQKISNPPHESNTDQQNDNEQKPGIISNPNMNINEFTLNRNDNEFFQIVSDKISSHCLETVSANKSQLMILNSQFSEMTKGLDIASPMKDRDKLSIISKRYSVIKTILEEFVRLIPNEEKDIMSKIRNDIDEIVSHLISRNTRLLEKLNENDAICTNYISLSQKYGQLYKAFQDKTEEVKALKNKLTTLEKSNASSKEEHETRVGHPNNSISINSFEQLLVPGNYVNVQSTNAIETSSANKEKEMERGKNKPAPDMDLDDLDSLYFFDKIDMRAHSLSHANIPKLGLQFSQTKKNAEDAQCILNNQVLNIPHHPKFNHNYLKGNTITKHSNAANYHYQNAKKQLRHTPSQVVIYNLNGGNKNTLIK